MAFLLAGFFGPLGAHHFYLGQTGSGLLYLFFLVFSFGLAIPLLWVLALAEGLFYLVNGTPDSKAQQQALPPTYVSIAPRDSHGGTMLDSTMRYTLDSLGPPVTRFLEWLVALTERLFMRVGTKMADATQEWAWYDWILVGALFLISTAVLGRLSPASTGPPATELRTPAPPRQSESAPSLAAPRSQNDSMPPEPEGPRLSQFNISDWSIHIQRYDTDVLGRLRNDGGVAAAAELQVSLFDGMGNLVDTRDFWPAGARNIAPGDAEPFKQPFFRTDVARGAIRVISVRRW